MMLKSAATVAIWARLLMLSNLNRNSIVFKIETSLGLAQGPSLVVVVVVVIINSVGVIMHKSKDGGVRTSIKRLGHHTMMLD